MVEVSYRDGGRPAHARSTPEQTGARARAHVVSKQVLNVLDEKLELDKCSMYWVTGSTLSTGSGVATGTDPTTPPPA